MLLFYCFTNVFRFSCFCFFFRTQILMEAVLLATTRRLSAATVQQSAPHPPATSPCHHARLRPLSRAPEPWSVAGPSFRRPRPIVTSQTALGWLTSTIYTTWTLAHPPRLRPCTTRRWSETRPAATRSLRSTAVSGGRLQLVLREPSNSRPVRPRDPRGKAEKVNYYCFLILPMCKINCVFITIYEL